MSESGEIIFMAMGAEEEYQWRRQSRHSLRLLSTETFCSVQNWLDSYCYFPLTLFTDFFKHIFCDFSNWLVQSWGGDVFPNSLRLGTRHHGGCPQQQIPGLRSSVFGCDLPVHQFSFFSAELNWLELDWSNFNLSCIELNLTNLSAEFHKVRGFAGRNPAKSVRKGGVILEHEARKVLKHLQ